jgi:hypothetical protein
MTKSFDSVLEKGSSLVQRSKSEVGRPDESRSSDACFSERACSGDDHWLLLGISNA